MLKDRTDQAASDLLMYKVFAEVSGEQLLSNLSSCLALA